ncbi:MAG: FxLYD domain-containing protein [Synergistaceae bacterium]|nr:FxLYD domain-containing protein [Synergistaceae bacterium]
MVLLGIFFGIGFMTGFFTGYGFKPQGFARGDEAVTPRYVSSGDGVTLGAPDKTDEETRWRQTEESDVPVAFDSGLSLEEHELGEDENGLFVSGTIVNKSDHSYDAVRVTFDLCDAAGKAYSGVTDVTYDRMAPGDLWGFTIYIPYSEMGLFSSYRLQSIIGASR